MKHIFNETDTQSTFEMPCSRIHSGDIIQLNRNDGSSIILYVCEFSLAVDQCYECVFNFTDDCPKFNVSGTYPPTMDAGTSSFTVGPYYLCHSCHPSSGGHCAFREVDELLEGL